MMMAAPRPIDRSTRFRVSIIAMLGFIVATLSATYLDSVLSTHVIFHHTRTYPLGYWIVLAAPAFLFATYAGFALMRRAPVVASWLPSTVLAIPFLWNFRPEFPHAGYTFDIVGYGVLAFATVVFWRAAALPAAVTRTDVPRD